MTNNTLAKIKATTAKTAQQYEPFGPPDDDFYNKRPDEGEIAQMMWSRTQLTVKTIRALKKLVIG